MNTRTLALFKNKMITIHKASLSDISHIQNMAHAIWPVVYKDIITIQQINYMLETRYSGTALENQIKSGQQFFIAKEEKEYLGYAGVAPTKHKGSFKLEKLYVIPDNHKKGIGGMLLNAVEEYTIQCAGNNIILQVNRQNAAVGFYLKKGFKIDREEDVEIGGGFYMNDYFMIKNIVK